MKRQLKIGGLSSLRLLLTTLLVATFVVGGSFAFGQADEPGDCTWAQDDDGNHFPGLVTRGGLQGDDRNEIRFNSQWDTDTDLTDDVVTLAALTAITIPAPTCEATVEGYTAPTGTEPTTWTYRLLLVPTTGDETPYDAATGLLAGHDTIGSFDAAGPTFALSDDANAWGKAPVKWKLEANWNESFPNTDHVPISYTFLITNDPAPHPAPTAVTTVRETQTSMYVEWGVTRIDGDGDLAYCEDGETDLSPCADNFLVTAVGEYEVTTTTGTMTRTHTVTATTTIDFDDAVNTFPPDPAAPDTPLTTGRLGLTLKGLRADQDYDVTVTGRSELSSTGALTHTSNRGTASTPAIMSSPKSNMDDGLYYFEAPVVAPNAETPALGSAEDTRFKISQGETVELDAIKFVNLAVAGYECGADARATDADCDTYIRAGVTYDDFRFTASPQSPASLAVEYLSDGDSDQTDDVVQITGKGDASEGGAKTNRVTVNARQIGGSLSVSGSIAVTVLGNNKPIFTVQSATLKWMIAPGDDGEYTTTRAFIIDVESNFVNVGTDEDTVEDCVEDESNADNCDEEIYYTVSDISSDSDYRGFFRIDKDGDGEDTASTTDNDGTDNDKTNSIIEVREANTEALENALIEDLDELEDKGEDEGPEIKLTVTAYDAVAWDGEDFAPRCVGDASKTESTTDVDSCDTMTIYIDVIEEFDDKPFVSFRAPNFLFGGRRSTTRYLSPLVEEAGGGSRTGSVASSFVDREGQRLCYYIDDSLDALIATHNGEEVTIGKASLGGLATCRNGNVTLRMTLPSTDPEDEEGFALLGLQGVHPTSVSVYACQADALPGSRDRGDAKCTDDAVKVQVWMVYGSNVAPILLPTAESGGETVVSGIHKVTEGSGLSLTFTATDPLPSGDKLCWANSSFCSRCTGQEEDYLYTSSGFLKDPKSTSQSGNDYEYRIVIPARTGRGIFARDTIDFERSGGTFKVDVCVTDLHGETAKMTFDVIVEDRAESPVVNSTAARRLLTDRFMLVGDEAQTFSAAGAFSDPDGDTLSYRTYCLSEDGLAEVLCGQLKVNVDKDSGEITITPPTTNFPDPTGEDEDPVTQMEWEVVVEVESDNEDDPERTADYSFEVTVKESNNAPRFADGLTGVTYAAPENKVTSLPTLVVKDDDGDTDFDVALSGINEKQFSSSGRYVATEGFGDDEVKVNEYRVTVRAGSSNKLYVLNYEADINSYDMTLTVSDKYGGMAELDVRVDVTDVNEKPVAIGDDIENQTILVGVDACIAKASEHFEDPDYRDQQAGLYIEAVTTRPSDASVVVKKNEDICITGHNVGSGPGRVTVTAEDRDGEEVKKRFNITVSENMAPTIVGDGIPDMTIQEFGRSEDINLNAYFDDGDADFDEKLTYELTMESNSVATGVLLDSYKLRVYADEKGETEATITATDQNGSSVSSTFTITVERNDPPTADTSVLMDIERFIGKNYDPVDATEVFSDPGDTLEYTVETSDVDTATAAIKLDEQGGPWIVIHLHAPGTTKVTINAEDSNGSDAAASFTLTVHPRNDPPTVANIIADVELENGANTDVDIEGTFEDEGDVDITIANENETIADVIYRSSTETIRIYANAIGTTTVVVTATDNIGQKVHTEFDITVVESAPVEPTNEPPVFVGSIDEQVLTVISEPPMISLEGLFEDPNGDELMYSAVSDNTTVSTVDLMDEELTVNPLAVGESMITITATDGEFNVVGEFNVKVINLAPVLVGTIDDQIATVGDPAPMVSIDGLFSDPEGDTLTYTASSADTNVATVDLSGLDLTINAHHAGSTIISVTAFDGEFNVVGTFDIEVETYPMAQGQIADQTLQIGGEDLAMDVAQYFFDEDGDTLDYSLTSTGNAATVSNTNANVMMIPYTRGATEVTITVMDPKGRSASQSFTVNVSDSELRNVQSMAFAGHAKITLGSVSSAVSSRLESSRSDTGMSFGLTNLTNYLPVGLSDSSEDAVMQERQESMGFFGTDNDSGIQQQSTLRSSWNTVSTDAVDVGNLLPDFSSMIEIENGFSHNLNGNGGIGSWSIWGTADAQNFEGEGYEGSASSLYLGFDVQSNECWLWGVSVARNTAESDYSWGTATQTMETNMTTILPYFSYEPTTGKTSVWGVVGRGSGDAETTVVNAANQVSDLSFNMGMLGGRQEFAKAGSLQLAFRGDVAFANMETADGNGAIDGLEASVNRLRAGVEGSFTVQTGTSGTVTPFGELAFRNDGGDGLTGTGFEVAGGVRMNTESLTLEARGRLTASHSAEDFSENGVSLMLSFNPSSDESGFQASFSPTWGQVSDDANAQWQDAASTQNLNVPSSGVFGMSNGLNLNSSMQYGFFLNQEKFMLTPFVDVKTSQDGLGNTILLGTELKQLFESSRTFGLRMLLGQDTAIEDSTPQLSVEAMLRF